MLIHAYAPLSRLLLSAAAKGRILVENRMKIQGLQSQAGVAWECMVLHITSVFAAEELPIKSDYERSESKDLMVHSDKPPCMVREAIQHNASQHQLAEPT
jgi:hypothetical protein